MDLKTYSSLVFFVNGKKVTELNPDPGWTLLFYLREICILNIEKHKAVPSCRFPVCAVHGLSVTTVEGVGSTRTKVHVIQESLALSHGTQCGFCTPGIVMSMYALLRNTPKPSQLEIEHAIRGNICRCTGYRPILDGFRTFADTEDCPLGEQCCQNIHKTNMDNLPGKDQTADSGDDIGEHSKKYDSSQEPIFPSELQLTDVFDSQCLKYDSEQLTWYRPVSLQQLLYLKHAYKDAFIVAGNTFGHMRRRLPVKDTVLISTSAVPELTKHSVHDEYISFGAAMSMSDVERILNHHIDNLPEEKTRYFTALKSQLYNFTGVQIKNIATIGGSVMTLVSNDINTTLACMPASTTFLVPGKEEPSRFVQYEVEDFFNGKSENKTDGNILLNVNVPKSSRMDYISSYQDLDKNVCSTFRVCLDKEQKFVHKLVATIGDRRNDIICLEIPRHITESAESARLAELITEKVAEKTDPMVHSLIRGYYIKFSTELNNYIETAGVEKFSRGNEQQPSCAKRYGGVQMYEHMSSKEKSIESIGRFLPHESGIQHACGEAVYVDDIPHISEELQLAMCLSTKAHARIIRMDTSVALGMPGVVDVISHKDVPAKNKCGFGGDELIFAVDKVTCYGQVVAAVVANTKDKAMQAACSVIIEYEDTEPTIVTIEDAICKESFYEDQPHLQHGDIAEGFSASDEILEGQVSVGGQEHFYMETNGCIIIPKKEREEFEVWVSSQGLASIQSNISEALGIPMNRIVVKAKRLGGGFGGKEFDPSKTCLAAVVAAHKLNRPVRCVLSREEDMLITGARHPMLANYKVGFKRSGQIAALDLNIYCNGGSTRGNSQGVLMHTILATSGAYHIQHATVRGRICKTNITSPTACRGFGAPEGTFMCETIITHIAEHLSVSQIMIRELNLINEGERTIYNQPAVLGQQLARCWNEVKRQSSYLQKKDEMDIFNRTNKLTKRGLSIVPILTGTGIKPDYPNQGGALMQVYQDGTVLLSHGGIEMGQGINTLMVQVASHFLEIPTGQIFTIEASTDKVPNSTNTAASHTADIIGFAVKNACGILKERLAPFKERLPNGSFKDWVIAAYMERVCLSVAGFAKFGTCDLDFGSLQGSKSFEYLTYGAACSYVEIDCLTGEHKILQTDIVMDVGKSINPGIAIGQIEGAFVQGLGLYLLEELPYTSDGKQLYIGPQTYKVPRVHHIPKQLNVTLLKDSYNPLGICSSKAIGEPPFLSALSVFFALRDAVMAVRQESGIRDSLVLNSPLTMNKIRIACRNKKLTVEEKKNGDDKLLQHNYLIKHQL